MLQYDPFAPGRFRVATREAVAHDAARDRRFPVEMWFAEDAPAPQPLIVYAHPSGASRRAATFLTTHLASHGYLVAAMDHSEVVAGELRRRENEAEDERGKRIDAVIAARVPDIRLLLDFTLAQERNIDRDRIGIVGHSFGGWTALAATGVDRRIRATVALAPAGARNPRRGILPVTVDFNWGRDVPLLVIAGDSDISIPLEGVFELFGRAEGTKRMVVLRGADHLHFMDDAAATHERFRTMPLTGDLAEMQKEMRPMAELRPEAEAHRWVRGLTLAHFDVFLRGMDDARRILEAAAGV